jgi:hypothetical protein
MAVSYPPEAAGGPHHRSGPPVGDCGWDWFRSSVVGQPAGETKRPSSPIPSRHSPPIPNPIPIPTASASLAPAPGRRRLLPNSRSPPLVSSPASRRQPPPNPSMRAPPQSPSYPYRRHGRSPRTTTGSERRRCRRTVRRTRREGRSSWRSNGGGGRTTAGPLMAGRGSDVRSEAAGARTVAAVGRWRRSDGSGSCHGWTSSLPSHGLAAANPHRPPPSSLCTLLSFPFLF